MSAHGYTEDLLIERPAVELFRELGWATVSAFQEIFGPIGTLQRETSAEVVLLTRLQAALTKLNPQLPPEAITAATDQLARDRSAMLPAAANREVYELLKDGVQVSVPDRERGGEKIERVRVIDWDDAKRNDLLLVSQMTVTGPLYTVRPDLIGFVNGLPLVLIEFKKPGVSARAAFDENITSYKHPQNGVPALFWYNALIIASNGTQSRVGTITADWGRMSEWKRVESEDEPRRVSLEVMIRGTCEPARLLDLVENFTLFSGRKAGLVKILAQNHQVLGVNAAIRSLLMVRGGLTKPATLTPTPLPKVEGHYRGGLQFAGLVDRARRLRQQQTSAEEIAWELLRDRQLKGWKFRRQHQIGDYIPDFFCAEKMLVVEVDGEVHTSPVVTKKDTKRDAYLHSLGYTVLRFQNEFVINQPAAFLEQITSTKALPSTSGRGVGGEGNTPSPNGIGVFWQTQGSGKSFSMVFFSQKVLRKIPGNWTFVVVTDRRELDDQIAKTFKATGAVTQHEGDECHAQSGAELRELLSGNHRYIFTLVQKFSVPEVLSERPDIIVLTDEAHRSQYDTLAVNMRASLPRAMFLAFTGTPLIAGEERTREVFGDYVSIYDFQQSVEDGATVPLFYENRTPELHLTNPSLNEEIYELIEEAELSEEAEQRLETQLGRQYHIITRDDRLEKVAKDIMSHFLGRGFQGKAMVVSIDKATALKMYDKVRKHWLAEQERVEKELMKLTSFTESDPERVRFLNERLALKNTDMALIVSPAQNEIEQMVKLGLDILPHRKRMNAERLDEKFKDPDDPLSLVFVCAMWLTGFDAPSCSTIYLDKPMRNHTLMQTIARANRVYPGKHSGLIVDYANVFASLEKALAIYGAGKGGATPVRDKTELVNELAKAVDAVVAFCAEHGVKIAAIEAATDMEKVRLIGDAVDALISPDPLRKQFLGHERLVRTLFQAIKPDPAVLEFASKVYCLTTIADEIRLRTGGGEPVDISAVRAKVNELLDDSIAADGFTIQEGSDGRGVIDLAKIDFDKLAKRFKQSRKKNIDLERLKAAIRAQLDKLIRLNKTRADYLTKFEELIESYNSGSRTIQELFEELLIFTRTLNEEEQRHVREQLSEAELTVFDLLIRPGPELSEEEREEVKKVARQLLKRVKQALGFNWRQTAQGRAQVRLAIEDELDDGLPRAYTPELYQKKCSAVFEHLFESFQQADVA
ncbi:MAG: HsdR family type I site-specific deoxyribonuclease [Chthoniobacterales bacterium]|nr:HsdR family type I site-specific deoxyribonuclease [Chthoniobacterales bacterium]